MRKGRKPRRSRKIFAMLPSGELRFHGLLHEYTFMRTLRNDYIRHSDKCFTINSSVIQTLWDANCAWIEFTWIKASTISTYIIEFSKAIKEGKLVKNERHEENLRIPISMCKLVKTINHEDPIEIKKEKEKVQQLSL